MQSFYRLRCKVQAVIDELRQSPEDISTAKNFASNKCREKGLPVKVAEVCAEAMAFDDFNLHLDYMSATGEIADYLGWLSGDHNATFKHKDCQVDILGFDAKVSDSGPECAPYDM